jgi:hypothetical protein
MDQERRIHRLLLQREREFTAVWRAECEINKILGAEYHFAEPPNLPSSYKPVKTKNIQVARQKSPKISSLIRSLDESENAYRVTYQSEDQVFSSFQTDTNLLRSLMPLQSSHFQMTLIETVRLKSLEDFDSLDILWKKGDLFQE